VKHPLILLNENPAHNPEIGIESADCAANHGLLPSMILTLFASLNAEGFNNKQQTKPQTNAGVQP
jgi:hypothetical protein